MAMGVCPECEECVGISTKGKRIAEGGTACWWYVDMHPDERPGYCHKRVPTLLHHQEDDDCDESLPCRFHGWPICEGTGRRI